MSGEALTAGRSATLQLVLQVVEVYDEGIDAFPRQRHQEVGSIQARNLGSFFLGDLATLIPVDRRRKPQLAAKFGRRAAEGRKHVFWEFKDKRCH